MEKEKEMYTKRFVQRGISIYIALVLLIGTMLCVYIPAKAADKPVLTVDMTQKKGDIIHGAAGFLYGVSNEGVPTTNTMVPLKPKVLATKGALGTEHPYGDALDVAKTFLESGGEQVMMYNSNYYGVFGVTADYKDFSLVLETIIAPAVVEWKNAWNEDHGTPKNPKDNIGARINIDEALIYIPINEGSPVNGTDFNNAWKSYYQAIKKVDKNAWLAGPNSAGYGWQYTEGITNQSHIQYCVDNDCLPDVMTWHELQTESLKTMKEHVADFKNIWTNLNWGDKQKKELPQIVINEYAEMIECGMPGRLVNWIARLEDEKIYGCLPFWHQANNLNDLAADANEGNGSWWLYKWYGDMSGQTLKVNTNTTYDALYGLGSIDDAKQSATVLFGGVDGEAIIALDNLDKTAVYKDKKQVHIKVQSTNYTGFHGAQSEVPTILEGTYPVNADGSVTVNMKNMKASTAYNITITNTNEEETQDGMVSAYQNVYEAEDGARSGNAAIVNHYEINPVYYFSGSNAVRMPKDASLTYEIEVPVDGKYKMEFIYGNGTGSTRENMATHNPINLIQNYLVDGKTVDDVLMESTLLENMTGTKTLYYDLRAGKHTIKITTKEDGRVLHDALNVIWAGAYKNELARENTMYEAEQADFNRIKTQNDDSGNSQVKTETQISGYSGSGYVSGLNKKTLENGGGIRWNVIVEKSGLYNLYFRYQAVQDGKLNVYVGNSTTTLDKLVKSLPFSNTKEGWEFISASIYLQKGINIVDIDSNSEIALDYMNVKEVKDEELGVYRSTIIEAEDCIPVNSQIKIASSSGASNGKYVVGMKGASSAARDRNKYLEIQYEAPADGTYELQAYQSNGDICGDHTYNTKIIDKYANFAVNGDTANAARYFFINTFSSDTFKEKTIQITLKKGLNKVRVYNDNSWNVLWGGTQSTPGTNELENFTPNFDKFVITPTSLETPIELPGEYTISVTTTAGGYASVDRNIVSENGEFNVTLKPDKGIDRILVNDVDKTEEIKNNKLKISDIKEDQFVKIYFTEGHGEYTDQYIANAGFGTGKLSESDWIASETVKVQRDTNNSYEGYYAKLGNQDYIKQLIKNIPQGNYELSFMAKGESAEDILELTVGTEEAQKIELGTAYQKYNISVSISANGELDFKAEAAGTVYLDNFKLAKAAEFDESKVSQKLEYFVDCGDHYPATLSAGEKFGKRNSVTDRLYGEDERTGSKWGVVSIDGYNRDVPYYFGSGKGAFTLYQWSNEREVKDELAKEVSFRYAHDQKENGINPRKVRYDFTLDDGVKYDVIVGFSNTWGNSGNPKLYLNDNESGSLNITRGASGVIEGTVTLTGENLTVEARSDDATIQMTYIKISKHLEDGAVDKADLQNLYDKVKDITNEGYIHTGWIAFVTARENASELLKEEIETTQSDVDIAEESLESAWKNLQKDIDENLVYFVDAGDHGIKTLSEGDRFGVYNSVTDQIFGNDPVTGKKWGVTDSDYTPERKPNQPGVYTKWTWANENDEDNHDDGQDKNISFRYARGQDSLKERYVNYKFQVDEDQYYEIEVGLGNHWGNSGTVEVYANKESEDIEIVKHLGGIKGLEKNANDTVTGIAAADKDGYISVDVRSTESATINVNYIKIREVQTNELVRLELFSRPDKVSYALGDELDLTGMVVKAVYQANGNKFNKRILDAGEYTVDGYDRDIAGNQTITVSYEEDGSEKSTAFDVTVKDSAILDKIEARTDKTQYLKNTRLEKSSLEVVAVYTDGTDITLLPDEYTVEGFDSSQVSESQILTVKYQDGDIEKTTDLIISILENSEELLYFVDAGDHNPLTLSEGDSFGTNNSLTDQIFGEDPLTGKNWGVLDPFGPETDNTPEDSNGVYTKHTWAYERQTNDNQRKEMTFRYARSQDQNPEEISELFVDYRFEVEPNQYYSIEIGLGNKWGNSSPVNVYTNRGEANETLIEEGVAIGHEWNAVVDGVGRADDSGYLNVNVRSANESGKTVLVNYIMIRKAIDPNADVTNVINLIDSIGEVSLTEISKAKIDAARAAYEDLSEERRALVTNIELLENAEQIYNDLKSVSIVVDLINSLGEPQNTEEFKNNLESVKEAYAELSDEQKKSVTNFDKFVKAEEAYNKLMKEQDNKQAADEVKKLINAIGKVEVSAACKSRIDKAEQAYNKLTSDQKKLVDNADIINQAKQTYVLLVKAETDKQAADAVKKLINAIGKIDTSIACKARIEIAEQAYNKLTADQKKLIDNAEIINQAKQTYAALEKAEKEKKEQVRKGDIYKNGNYKYKITDVKKKTVTLMQPTSKKIKKIVVPDTVKIKNKKYKVTAINKSAFSKCNKATSAVIGKNVQIIGTKAFYKCANLRKLTFKGTNLRKVYKQSFLGIHKNAKIKVPSKKYRTYEKLLKNKGQKKSVKIIK